MTPGLVAQSGCGSGLEVLSRTRNTADSEKIEKPRTSKDP